MSSAAVVVWRFNGKKKKNSIKTWFEKSVGRQMGVIRREVMEQYFIILENNFSSSQLKKNISKASRHIFLWKNKKITSNLSPDTSPL